MVDAADGDHGNGPRASLLLRQLAEAVDVQHRDLGVELAVDEKNRLPDISNDSCGVEAQKALEPRRICLLPHFRGQRFPAAAARHGGVDSTLKFDLGDAL